MKKPKYNTTHEATQKLWEIIRHLDALIMMERPNGQGFCDYDYQRMWDDKGKWISDNLTAYRGAKSYITSVSPEKFEEMSSEVQASLLNEMNRKVS